LHKISHEGLGRFGG